VLVRSDATWRELVPELANVTLARTANPRTAYLSRRNLGPHWEAVFRAVSGATT
jgi:hypothetical protein